MECQMEVLALFSVRHLRVRTLWVFAFGRLAPWRAGHGSVDAGHSATACRIRGGLGCLWCCGDKCGRHWLQHADTCFFYNAWLCKQANDNWLPPLQTSKRATISAPISQIRKLRLSSWYTWSEPHKHRKVITSQSSLEAQQCSPHFLHDHVFIQKLSWWFGVNHNSQSCDSQPRIIALWNFFINHCICEGLEKNLSGDILRAFDKLKVVL